MSQKEISERVDWFWDRTRTEFRVGTSDRPVVEGS
jgi:hypothetical protein